MIISSDMRSKDVIAEPIKIIGGAIFTAAGVIDAPVNVEDGRFILSGILNGELTVGPSSSAVINGIANCPAISNLGLIEVGGIAMCDAMPVNGVVIHSGSIVNGERQ